MTTPSFPAISEFISELSTLVRLSESLKKEIEQKDKKITKLQKKQKKLLKIINDLSKRSEDTSEEVEEIDETTSQREFTLFGDENWSHVTERSVRASSAYEAAIIFSERICGGEIIPKVVSYQFTGDSGNVIYQFTSSVDTKGVISTIFDLYTVPKIKTKKSKTEKMDLDTFFKQLTKGSSLLENLYHPLDENSFVFRKIKLRGDKELICIGFEDDEGIQPLTPGPTMELQVFLAKLGVEDLQTLEEVKDRLNPEQLKEYRKLIPSQRKIVSHPQKVIDECLELNVARGVYYWSTHLMFCEMKIDGRDEIVCVGTYPGCEYDETDESNEFMDSQPLNYFYMRMLRDFEKDSGFSVLNIRDLYVQGPGTFSECQDIMEKLVEAGLMPDYD